MRSHRDRHSLLLPRPQPAGDASDIIGAHAAGAQHSHHHRDRRRWALPRATASFDIDSIGLTNSSTAQPGLDPQQPSRRHEWAIGVGVNPGAGTWIASCRGSAWKVTGAEFAVTQPVFDARQSRRF